MPSPRRCGAPAPGVTEYELAAVANFVFLAGGARGEGYRAIVGGGQNAWFGHYGRLADPLRDGDLVLMDHAADFAYYTSDIGRMWPVNGTFTPCAANALRIHRGVPPSASSLGSLPASTRGS